MAPCPAPTLVSLYPLLWVFQSTLKHKLPRDMLYAHFCTTWQGRSRKVLLEDPVTNGRWGSVGIFLFLLSTVWAILRNGRSYSLSGDGHTRWRGQVLITPGGWLNQAASSPVLLRLASLTLPWDRPFYIGIHSFCHRLCILGNTNSDITLSSADNYLSIGDNIKRKASKERLIKTS